jgi:hypothetical protein
MEVLDHFPRSNLIALPNASKAASQIKRLVFRHKERDAKSGTSSKTERRTPWLQGEKLALTGAAARR